MKVKKETGEAAFESFYAGVFGERWPGLRTALAGPGASREYGAGLQHPYHLDAASILAARTLMAPDPDGHAADHRDGERILDMCAAPGGKSLVIASLMQDGDRLTANERSAERRARMARVFAEHLEAGSRIDVLGRDAATLARGARDAWDRILLDAPCSSERHVLAAPEHLARWSPARTRHLAQEQWALLSAAFLLVRPGGIIVYSTCALSPLENDGVINRLLDKYGEGTIIQPVPDVPDLVTEPTAHGVMILPDCSDGAGPLFICRIKKRAAT